MKQYGASYTMQHMGRTPTRKDSSSSNHRMPQGRIQSAPQYRLFFFCLFLPTTAPPKLPASAASDEKGRVVPAIEAGSIRRRRNLLTAITTRLASGIASRLSVAPPPSPLIMTETISEA